MKSHLVYIYVLCLFVLESNAQQTVNPRLLEAAGRGDIIAQKHVSDGYKNGIYGFRKNPSQAFYWMSEAAHQGDAEAQYMLSKYYKEGFGTIENREESLSWMKKAADNNLTEAQSEYGFWKFREGQYTEAVQYLQKAANKDNALAMFYYGQALVIGLGVEQNPRRGIEYVESIMDIMPEAVEFMANLYSRGLGVRKDINKSIKLFDQAISKKPNDFNFIERKGLALLDNGKYKDATDVYRLLCSKIEKYPTFVDRPFVAAMTNSIDYNIPVASRSNDRTIVLIIANEHYRRVSPVVYANSDGQTMYKYCTSALGIPERNIIYVVDATLADMKYNVESIKQRIGGFNGDCNVICYYAGHGIPDQNAKTAFLLPVDSYGTDTSTGYPLEDFYKSLSELPTKSVTVLLDACFSGAKREGDMLVAARGVAIKVKDTKPKGNLVVISAAQGDETAYPYENQKHGLFTYFLLRKIQETNAECTLGEIVDYVKSEVLKKSIEMNGKSQTPSVSVSMSLENTWRNKRLK